MKRVNKLKNEPEFYNTLSNNCTTNIIDHVNTITPKKIPFRIESIMPENSDQVAYELGLIDTDLSFEDARAKFLINERAKETTKENFSLKIRGR